jgi:hypothetical protein
MMQMVEDTCFSQDDIVAWFSHHKRCALSHKFMFSIRVLGTPSSSLASQTRLLVALNASMYYVQRPRDSSKM